MHRQTASDDTYWRSAEDELIDLLSESEVVEAINALPVAYRQAVMLSDVEGFAYREVAEQLDVPIGTVKSRLARAKDLLSKELQIG